MLRLVGSMLAVPLEAVDRGRSNSVGTPLFYKHSESFKALALLANASRFRRALLNISGVLRPGSTALTAENES
jgi:hypothetical protein